MPVASNHRLAVVLAAFVVVLAGVAASVHAQSRADAWVMHTLRVKVALGDYQIALLDAETAQRGFVISGDERFLEPYIDASARRDEAPLLELTRDNPRQQARLQQLGALRRAKLEELTDVVDVARQDREAAFARVRSGRGKALMDDVRGVLAELQEEEDRLFERRHADAQRAFVITVAALVATSVLFGLSLLSLLQSRRDLQRAHEQASAVEFNDRFVAVLGHDLKNPLTAMRIGLERLELAAHPDVRPLVKRIERSADRMTRMVDQLLDLTRIRIGGGIELKKSAFDVAEVVRDVVDELRTAYPSRVVELDVHGETTGRFDRGRLAQIATNLVGNAAAHGAEGTPVRVSVSGSGPRMCLRVASGGEMEKAVRDVLFEPFERSLRDAGKTARSAGMGLGLFIVRHLVEQHGGVLDVTSDRETVFTVTLPR